MIIKFQKFQGAGNDFIIIDNRNQVYEFTREIVEYFCDRKFGIGADGLMLLETCPGYDFTVLGSDEAYTNPDQALKA